MGNPDLRTYDRKVDRVSDPVDAQRNVVFVLNKESLTSILWRKGRIYYGFDSIRLLIYRGDEKSDPAASTDKQKEAQVKAPNRQLTYQIEVAF